MKTIPASIAASAVAALTLALTGCANGDPVDPVNPLGYADPIVVRPAPDSPDTVALTASLNDVGFDLFRYVASQGDEDVVLSPLSIGLAFGMLDLGATGTVEEALDELFAYPVDGDARYSAFNALEQGVVNEPDPVATPDGPDAEAPPVLPTVRVANRMFRDDGFEAYPEYAEGLARWFGAGIEPLNIAEDPEAARIYINKWISDRTMGLIPDLLSPGSVNPDTAVLLVNALYFKASWLEPFDFDSTKDDDFTLLDGTTVSVPFMRQFEMFKRAVFGDGYTAVEIPYTGDLSLLVIVPDPGLYREVESRLDGSFLAEIDDSLEGMLTNLYFPSFTSEHDFDLREALEGGLGVTGLFDVPDLKGIGEDIWVGGAIHAAKIIVDEEGTEAAAVTVISMPGSAAPSEDEPVVVDIRVDLPFLYVIRDDSTGAVLFVGRVLDPSD